MIISDSDDEIQPVVTSQPQSPTAPSLPLSTSIVFDVLKKPWGISNPVTPNKALIVTGSPQTDTDATNAQNIRLWNWQSIMSNCLPLQTLITVERAPHMHIIPLRYLFKIKKDVDVVQNALL